MHIASLSDRLKRKLKRIKMRRVEIRTGNKYFNGIDKGGLSAIHLFSTSRSGSHLSGAQFQFIENCFVFRENHFATMPGQDPFLHHPGALDMRAFLFHSCFREDGLQNKSGENLTHLVYMHNMPLNERVTGPLFTDEGLRPPTEPSGFKNTYYIFHFRNPFQVAMSRQDYFKKNDKKNHWEMTNDVFKDFLAQEEKRLKYSICLQSKCPDNVKIVFHELLCREPDIQFENIFHFCKIDPKAISERKNPMSFFGHCFDHEETPRLDDSTGYLINPATGNKILGAGGRFNPLAAISMDRTHKYDVLSWMNDKRIELASQILPAKAVDFWLNSTPDSYNDLTHEQLVDLLSRNERAQ